MASTARRAAPVGPAPAATPGRERRPGIRWLIGVVGFLALCLPGAVAAQRTGSAVLRGQVADSAGVGIDGADVSLRDTADAIVAATVSDGQGRFIMVGLPSGGPYTLVAEHLAYATGRRDRIFLASGESRRLDLVLTTRAVELPGLVVSAPDLVFSGTRTGASTVVEERAIVATPTVERSVMALAELSPMVSITDDRVSVAGQNSRFNSLRVDGALSQDVYGLSPSGVPGGQANARALPMAAIRQYSVSVAPYDVRQSGFTGALLNATTRTGGDRWEASAFGYYRGDAFSRSEDDSDVVRTFGQGASNEFSTLSGGFTAGGPLGPARLFVAGELEERRRPMPGFQLGVSDPYRVGLAADSVDRLVSLLADRGLDAGSADSYTLENPLGNLFARLDAPLGAVNTLSIRYNLISADKDVAPNRLGFDTYGLTSAGTRLESRTHNVVGRLTSKLAHGTTNELSLNVQTTMDRTRGGDQPAIEVEVRGTVQDTLIVRRPVLAGGDPLAHADQLDQTVVQLTDHVSHAVGDHLFSVGVDGSWFGIRRRFLPASRGVWRYSSLAALEADAPGSYERLVLKEGADPDIEFSLLQMAGFLQDEWSLSDALALTLGLRVDWPITLSRPGYNRGAEIDAGVVTDRLPSANPLLAPRLGLNWSPNTERRLQVRGGVGIFTGTPPMAWLADAYANTGLRTGFLQCDSLVAPGLQPGAPPAQCLDGDGPGRPDLVVFKDDFRYPQDLRASIAVDRELPFGFVGTLEAVYTRALQQPALEDINLPVAADPQPGDAEGYAFPAGTRPIFGVPVLIAGRFGFLDPRRRWDGYGHVLRVGNRSRNAAVAVAAELQRRFSQRLDFRLAYTYTRAVDVRSLLYQDAALNYGRTPVRADPARPDVAISAFDRTHRVVGSIWVRLAEWGGGLDATIRYIGQSGTPYSYVYGSDMNGDGFPGPGALERAYNDLLYVPMGLSDLGGEGIVQRSLLLQLVGLEDCLNESAGFIAARNTCRTPWSDRVDISLSQEIRLPVGAVRIRADLMNALNLINQDWGLVYAAPPVVPVYEVDGRRGCPGFYCDITNPLVGHYIGPRRLDQATGFPVAELPYVPMLPESQWRAQLGLELTLR